MSSPTPLSESVYRLQSAVYTYVLVVLVLILIKDALTIKRMLTTWHSFTRDLFIYQVVKADIGSVCCLRLQLYFYPGMVATGLGRRDGLRHS